jgi:hypothetical protein
MPAGATYELIATYTVPSTTTSYTFTSIPQTYTDLILVGSTTSAGTTDIRFNSDSGSNYGMAQMWGPNGSDVYSQGAGGNTAITNGDSGTTVGASPFVSNIFQYTNTNIYKRIITEADDDRYGRAYKITGHWRNLAAITSVSISSSSNGMNAGSVFTLYGISGV